MRCENTENIMDLWNSSGQLVNGGAYTPQSSTRALDLTSTTVEERGLRPTAHKLPGQETKIRKRKGAWKKLLWVKQPYPDNYTDEETFLDHLQRNPRLQPYEFWPLVADASVIVQQVCTVVIFVSCFSCILQDRVSPVTMVTWGSGATVLGWILWDIWVGREESEESSPISPNEDARLQGKIKTADQEYRMSFGRPELVSADFIERSKDHTIARGNSEHDVSELPSSHHASRIKDLQAVPQIPTSRLSNRSHKRLATAKSALLIYCALLGLSPILESLTKSTASDSIWAISFWLMCINIFFFDYGGGIGATFPASLSTNAALMASTVLASRLPSTTHVFSLTLFSIEVFGLFPVFRRYLRLHSSVGHLGLSASLVMGAGGGVAVSVSGGGWSAAVLGSLLGSVLIVLAMGLCSWWLIGLQQYKNEIHGPWDPARPIIRRRWD